MSAPHKGADINLKKSVLTNKQKRYETPIKANEIR